MAPVKSVLLIDLRIKTISIINEVAEYLVCCPTVGSFSSV